jgi:hypothetical protein
MLYCGQELINGNFTTAFLPPPPIYYTGPPRNLSPPWRPDDKDGHYVFVVGENLTPRCIFLQLNDVHLLSLHWVARFWFASLNSLSRCIFFWMLYVTESCSHGVFIYILWLCINSFMLHKLNTGWMQIHEHWFNAISCSTSIIHQMQISLIIVLTAAWSSRLS